MTVSMSKSRCCCATGMTAQFSRLPCDADSGPGRRVLALDEAGTRAGAYAPEDWADPQAFYKALERVGTPNGDIVEAVL